MCDKTILRNKEFAFPLFSGEKAAMFHRCVIFLGILSFLLSFTAGNAWGAVSYTVTDLGALFGNYSQATGINASGQVVGTIYYYAYHYAFLSSNGTALLTNSTRTKEVRGG